MNKRYLMLALLSLFADCSKGTNPARAVLIQELSGKWQYVYSSKCPYNPASMAPCFLFSQQDTFFWNPKASFLSIDSNGEIRRSFARLNPFQLLQDSMQVVPVNGSTVHVSNPSQPATSIRVRTLQAHLLVLEFIADSFNNPFELDSLIR